MENLAESIDARMSIMLSQKAQCNSETLLLSSQNGKSELRNGGQSDQHDYIDGHRKERSLSTTSNASISGTKLISYAISLSCSVQDKCYFDGTLKH